MSDSVEVIVGEEQVIETTASNSANTPNEELIFDPTKQVWVNADYDNKEEYGSDDEAWKWEVYSEFCMD